MPENYKHGGKLSKMHISQGGGTAAQLMLQSWPSLQLESWEIDGIVKILLIGFLFLFSWVIFRSSINH